MSACDELTNKITGTEPAIGSFFKSGSPLLAEALGVTPLDFILIDYQHSTPDTGNLEHLIRAAQINDLPSIVRIPHQRVDMINTALDMGACGLMIPQVSGPENLRSFLDEVSYEKGRSISLSTRAGDFGKVDNEHYITNIEKRIQVIPQIESRVGRESVEEIARMEGVDAIMPGPADLAISYGEPIGSEKVQDIIQKIIEEVSAIPSCGFGLYAQTPEGILQARKEDPAFILYSHDIGLLVSEYESAIEGPDS